MASALVGVLVGSVLSVVVLWVISPRVQGRIRSQERWEDEALALLRNLGGEIPRAGLDYQIASGAQRRVDAKISAGELDTNRDGVAKLVAEIETEFRATKARWELATGWEFFLRCDRVLGRYGVAHGQYRVVTMMLRTNDLVRGEAEVDDSEIEELWEQEQRFRRDLMSMVSERTEHLSVPPRRLRTGHEPYRPRRRRFRVRRPKEAAASASAGVQETVS